ncbi:hypothetical protein ABIE21_003290 [Conyzicola nivalis]|uniref:HNH endonuclease n=1 Tax=Conyzicola nivalis TaxID=1477021 RepID=A0ABV2QRS2_9MICO
MIHFDKLGSKLVSRRSEEPDVEWGVSYADANHMGEVDSAGRDLITTPQRQILLVPVVIMHPAAHGYLRTRVDFTTVQADQIRLPMVQTVDPTVVVRMQDTRLTVLDGNSKPFFTVDLDERTAWFIRHLGNVGVVLVGESGKAIQVATLALGSTMPYATVALHKGSVGAKGRDNILRVSEDWKAIVPGSSHPFSGPGLDADDRLWVYYGDRKKIFFPATFPQSCFICGSHDVNREHCTPKWLADKLQLMPVVAGVLCEPCNSRLGKSLEAPVSQLFDRGKLADPANGALVNHWMAKTAATLGAAANIKVPETLRQSVDTGDLDPGLMIWARATAIVTEAFFRFRVISFTAERENRDWFIATFEFNGFAFAVAHLPGADIDAPDWFPMTHPNRKDFSAGSAGVEKVLAHLMTSIGTPIDVYADAEGRVPPPRTAKGPRGVGKA